MHQIKNSGLQAIQDPTIIDSATNFAPHISDKLYAVNVLARCCYSMVVVNTKWHTCSLYHCSEAKIAAAIDVKQF